MAYLFEKPLLLDAGDTEKLLGVTASSLDTMVRDTLSQVADMVATGKEAK
jgi:hypothetical protein